MTIPSKDILRVQALYTLTHLSLERRQQAAIAAYSFLIDHFAIHTSPILSFMSKPLEISMHPFNHYLLQKKALLLPKKEGEFLHIYQVESIEQLNLSNFGILEPCSKICRKVSLEEISWVLVPGLCFDRKHRVGYGKGCFDRFLSQIPWAKKWGIGFKEQKIEKIPFEPHDISLDEVFFF